MTFENWLNIKKSQKKKIRYLLILNEETGELNKF
jgi:hypothetical protein